jgi:hypothetical protein
VGRWAVRFVEERLDASSWSRGGRAVLERSREPSRVSLPIGQSVPLQASTRTGNNGTQPSGSEVTVVARNEGALFNLSDAGDPWSQTGTT